MAKEPAKSILADPPESLKIFDSVVVLSPAPTGGFQAQEVYTGEGVSRNTGKKLRPREKFIRKLIRAERTVLDEYTQRHEKSAAKKKNGWAKDFGKNLSKSLRKGRKQLKIKTLF